MVVRPVNSATLEIFIISQSNIMSAINITSNYYERKIAKQRLFNTFFAEQIIK
ncbi:hypothetical protein VIBNIAM115_270050 [Vibrio nigripulchritudo AM115]|nr:hypothetical protein VIBNIAM115_270050 [Vibrio nigripulchritudo AM115]